MAISGKLFCQDQGLFREEISTVGPLKIFFVEHFGFQNFLNKKIFAWLDILADHGVNGMRTSGFWPFAKGKETEPFLKTGGRYDLSRFNDAYFDYLHAWISYASEKGVVVLFELFDSWGIANKQYGRFHPFHQHAQGNLQAFSNLRNDELVTLQKCYIDRVIQALRPNRNVILGLMHTFTGSKDWHSEMSRHVRTVAPEYLISGSHEKSPAVDDPNVDIWFIHTGSYDFETGESHLAEDRKALRAKAGNRKILGFSTAGFGAKGKLREGPEDMRRLARDAASAGMTFLSFLDHKAYAAGGVGDLSRANIATYQAMVAAFQPTSFALKGRSFDTLGTTTEQFSIAASTRELPSGYLDIFRVAELPSTHPGAFLERGGRSVRATVQQGFLCFGQYRKGYPETPLRAIFSLLIDNNTADDCNVLILDIYDRQSDRVLVKQVIARKDFPQTNEPCLFAFDFTPPGPRADMEFRIYYLGNATVSADVITIVDPSKVPVSAGNDAQSSVSGTGRDLSNISTEPPASYSPRKLRPFRSDAAAPERLR